MIGLRLLLCLALASFAAPAMAQTSPEAARLELGRVTAEDRVLGRADAPVTVVEYASFMCPHCATWHLAVLPEFKARFIDTGQVKLVFRDLPTPPSELSIPAAVLARCAAPEAYFEVADALMSGQGAVRAGGDPNAWAQAAANKAGRSIPEIQACMSDGAARTQMAAGIDSAVSGGINSTPSFLVNGRLVADSSLEGLAAAITPLLPPAPAP